MDLSKVGSEDLMMTDEERMENLARIGLRVISAIYSHHPRKANVTFEVALGLSDITSPDDPIYTEVMKRNDPLYASSMISRMIEDGVIRGNKGGTALSEATLPGAIRKKLLEKEADGTPQIDVIRRALREFRDGSPPRLGKFIALAREIGFEP